MEIVRAKQEHCSGIAKIVSKRCCRYFFPKHNFDGMSDDNVASLASIYVARCCLPLIVVDTNHNNRVIAFAAINDYPHPPNAQNKWPNKKSEWLSMFYAQHGQDPMVGSYDMSLFLLCFAVARDYVDSGIDIIESIAQYTFTADEFADHITLNLDLNGTPPFGISKLFRIVEHVVVEPGEASLGGMNEMTWSLGRYDIVRQLETRPAKVEDYDDLVEMVETQSEVLTSVYGSFFLADLIEAQDENHRAISAVDQNGKAVGILCASTEVNLKVLQENFQLENFDNLMKEVNPTTAPAADDASEESIIPACSNLDQENTEKGKQVVNEDTTETIEKPNEVQQVNIEDESIEESKTEEAKVKDDAATVEAIDAGSDETSNTVEKQPKKIEEPVTTDVDDIASDKLDKDEETTEDAKTPGQVDDGDTAQPTVEVEQSGEESLSADKVVEQENKSDGGEEDVQQTTSEEEETLTKEQNTSLVDKYESNAFALSMICLDEVHHSRVIDLLRGAFEAFPTREYCVLTLPFTTQESLISPYFTLVPMKSTKHFPHALYILHREVVCLFEQSRVQLQRQGLRPMKVTDPDAKSQNATHPMSHYELVPVTVIDFDQGTIQAVVEGMPEQDAQRVIATAWSHLNMIENGNSGFGVFLAYAGYTPIGIVTMCKFADRAKDMFDIHLNLEIDDSFDSYRMSNATEVAVLSHFVLDPRFTFLSRYILRDAMSALGVTHLMYGVSHRDKIPAMVLDLFHLVKSRCPLVDASSIASPLEESGFTTQSPFGASQRIATPRLADSTADNEMDVTTASKSGTQTSGHVRPIHQDSPEEQFLDTRQATMPLNNVQPTELISARLRNQMMNTGGVVTEEEEELDDENHQTILEDQLNDTPRSTPRSQRLSLIAGSLEPYSVIPGATPRCDNNETRKPDLAETIRTVGNFLLHKPQLYEAKTTVNARITVVGASDSGLATLETLLSANDLRFNNITLLTPGGLPLKENQDEIRSFATVGVASQTGFNWKRIANMALSCKVGVVNGTMHEINRSDKSIRLRDGSSIQYDYMVIATGKQDATRVPSVENSTTCCNNFHRIQSWETATRLNEAVETEYWASNAKVLVYGASLEALSVIQSLLVRGWDPKQIVYCFPEQLEVEKIHELIENQVCNTDQDALAAHSSVTNPSSITTRESISESPDENKEQENDEEDDESPRSEAANTTNGNNTEDSGILNAFPKLSAPTFLFKSSIMTCEVFKRMIQAGIEVHAGVTLVDAVIDPSSNKVTAATFRRENADVAQEEISHTIPCEVLICAGNKDVDNNLFQAVNGAGLVYDGGLVVDASHCTVDPSIFGTGSVTKFARGLGGINNLKDCNSEELGERVCHKLLESMGIAAPVSRFTKSFTCDGFQQTVVNATSLVLPGDLQLFQAQMPASMKVASGRVLETSSTCGRYCRIELDLLGRIQSILCIGHELRHEQFLPNLVGRHSTLFDLEAAVDSGNIKDLIEYICDVDFGLVTRHDKFKDLARDVRETLLNSLKESPEFAALFDNLVRVTVEEHKNPDGIRALREEVVGPSGVGQIPKDILMSVERRVIDFVNRFQSELGTAYTTSAS